MPDGQFADMAKLGDSPHVWDSFLEKKCNHGHSKKLIIVVIVDCGSKDYDISFLSAHFQ
jgi:hypothetical protein